VRIAIVGDALSLYTARERLDGYRRALATRGIQSESELISMGHGTLDSACEAVSELMTLPHERRPTAIFTANNRCTIGALHALETDRDRVALVGFDEFELADLLSVTVVRIDPYRMGQVAAEIALGTDEEGPHQARRLVVPVELVIRGSGEVPPR